VRRWLRETEPDRRVRNDAALRVFFLWLLEPDEARAQLERERDYWRGILSELLAIREQPSGTTRKEQAFRLALEGGIRTVEARVAWLESAAEQSV
jgi:PadR family transcriptional regulator, regulatory protein AphA